MHLSLRTWGPNRLAVLTSLLFVGLLLLGTTPPTPADPSKPVAIAVHGGAGAATPDVMGEQRAAAYRTALREALEQGHELLTQGAEATEAVTAAVKSMEDNPLFNAGRGAVRTAAGEVELEASIMAGDRRQAGAVAALQRLRSPVRAARLTMEESEHVMLAGPGAESFAEEAGLEPAYRPPRSLRASPPSHRTAFTMTR